MCQRWSSGPFFAVSASGVSFAGEDNLVRFRSSEWAERGFCKVCGSNLFYRMHDKDDYELCVGAINEKQDIVLSGEIFIDQKTDGFNFAGDHPRLTAKETIAKFTGEGA